MVMETTQNHINGGGGICGTCARPAAATFENEGYSDCCNDRIEYGDEARQTYRQATCPHEHTTTTNHPHFGPETECNDCGGAVY